MRAPLQCFDPLLWNWVGQAYTHFIFKVKKIKGHEKCEGEPPIGAYYLTGMGRGVVSPLVMPMAHLMASKYIF